MKELEFAFPLLLHSDTLVLRSNHASRRAKGSSVSATGRAPSAAIAMIAIMYFVGLTVSRIGSLIIEPLAKKAKLIQYHKGFYLAERNDPKIKVLLKDFNMYRNIAASAIISIVMTLIRAVSLPFDGGELAVRITVLALVFVVYFAAYAKQSVSINNRIKHAKERNLK